jgi:hypothetical protein
MESFMTLSEFNHHVYCLNAIAIQHLLKWFHSTFNHYVLKWFNSTLKLRSKIACTCHPHCSWFFIHYILVNTFNLYNFVLIVFLVLKFPLFMKVTCSKLVSFIGNGINQIHLSCVYDKISWFKWNVQIAFVIGLIGSFDHLSSTRRVVSCIQSIESTNIELL